jgi:hypothetical protein
MTGSILVENPELDAAYRALYFIAHVDQGCGGTLTYEEMAKSAMRQAQAVLPKGYRP